MDGLLIDSERIVQQSWKIAGERMGYQGMDQIIYPLLGVNRAGRDLYFKEHLGEDFPCEEFAVKASEAFYEIAKDGVPIKEGAREILEYGKSKGFSMALTTSSRKEYASNTLGSLGILDYFDGMVTGDMVTHSKPDPEIYLRGAKLLGMDPAECMALEDAVAGIKAAYGAGTIPILVPDLIEPPEEIVKLAYRKCKSLLEVIPILEELERDKEAFIK